MFAFSISDCFTYAFDAASSITFATSAEVCQEQRRLAYHAPATALAVNKRKPTYAEAAKAMQSANSALYQVLLRVDVRLGGKNAAELNRRFHAWVGVK
jgi:hypothetical protein